jgi:hypothetical protein
MTLRSEIIVPSFHECLRHHWRREKTRKPAAGCAASLDGLASAGLFIVP